MICSQLLQTLQLTVLSFPPCVSHKCLFSPEMRICPQQPCSVPVVVVSSANRTISRPRFVSFLSPERRRLGRPAGGAVLVFVLGNPLPSGRVMLRAIGRNWCKRSHASHRPDRAQRAFPLPGIVFGSMKRGGAGAIIPLQQDLAGHSASENKTACICAFFFVFFFLHSSP